MRVVLKVTVAAGRCPEPGGTRVATRTLSACEDRWRPGTQAPCRWARMPAPQRVTDFQGRRRRQSVYIPSELTDMFTVLRSLLLTCQAAGRTTSQVEDWRTEHQEETCGSQPVPQP